MASIWMHPQSKYWFACFTTADGRRTKRSTKTTDRKRAQKLADEFEEAAQKKRTALQTRKVIQELHAKITGEDLVFPSVRDHFQKWLLGKTGVVADATLVFYQGVSTKFLNWLGQRADADLASVVQSDIENFRSIEAASLAAKTVNHEIKTLKMIFREAFMGRLITDDPAYRVKTLKQTNSTRRAIFTDQQIQKVLAAADPEWRSMVLFAIYTGQRLIDIALLTSQSVDLAGNTIRLTTRKTGRAMIIPVAPPLHRHIEALNLSDNAAVPIHPSAFKIATEQGKSGHLSNQFASLLAKVGFRKKKPHRKTGEGRGRNRDSSGLSFHSLRHTAVTLLKEAGIPQAVVMEMIGHDSEQMSQHYTHVGQEALKKAAESLPDFTVVPVVTKGGLTPAA